MHLCLKIKIKVCNNSVSHNPLQRLPCATHQRSTFGGGGGNWVGEVY